MDDQIQVYHDATAFWLDRSWRTPAHKRLEKQVELLRAQLKGMSALMDIPCCYCGRPLPNNWEGRREKVVDMFRTYQWHHHNCKPRNL